MYEDILFTSSHFPKTGAIVDGYFRDLNDKKKNEEIKKVMNEKCAEEHFTKLA